MEIQRRCKFKTIFLLCLQITFQEKKKKEKKKHYLTPKNPQTKTVTWNQFPVILKV